MNLRPIAVAAVSMALAALACVSLNASLIVPTDLPTLVREAQAIALGRVTDVRGVIRPGTRRVESYVVFAVDEPIKGVGARTLIFKTLGGTSGRYTTVVPGSPVFAPGDEAVVFLGRGTTPYPIGLSHGVFRVRADRMTGERRILPPPTLLDPKSSMTIRRGDGTRVPVAVAAFTSRLRRLAAGRQP
ncbi:MAG TPA: hypothetical protein VFZ36_09580 [Vicinamibacterales bacterium]